MRASNRLLVAAVLLASPTSPLRADTTPSGRSKSASDLVHDLWNLVSEVSVKVGLQGGSSIDLSDLSRPDLIEKRLSQLLQRSGEELRLTVPGGKVLRGNFSLDSAESHTGHLLVLEGSADIHGALRGNLVTVEGDVIVHPGAVVSGDVLALGGTVRDQGGEIAGEVRTLESTNVLRTDPTTRAEAITPLQSVLHRIAGVLGVFLTLVVLGFGLVMFGRQNLEIVSDTVSHSFGRAFVAGLLGQILLLPTFGMLVVGLILSVAGILLLPFAIAVFAMLTVVAVVGGYLAVAHAMGETYTRRRMARGVVIGSPNSYRYLLVGLLALASLWAAWALFGWVPVAGSIIWGTAFFVSWLLGTAGFGAALLSRAGIKENFAGRLLPPEALTDEYLWATPQFGVTAGRRPGTRTPSRGL
jgi:hypothetical protein